MREYTVSGRQANLYGLLYIIPVLLFSCFPYILIWSEAGSSWKDRLSLILDHNQVNLHSVIDTHWWLLLLVLIAGIVLHELIHGIFMATFARDGWKSVSFGFNLKAMAPYAHCKEPLKINEYRLSLAMPGILMGEVPVLISWFTGNILVLFFGILFCWAAFGDLMIIWLSRNITDGLLQDHPKKIGFIHIEKN